MDFQTNMIFHYYTVEIVMPPTRHPMWVSSGGVTLRDCDRDWDSLTFSFSSFRADTCIHMHNLCNNKNLSFYIYIIHTTIVAFIILCTHTRIPLLVLLQFHYYITIHIKSEITEQCGEHLSLRWPALLMWNVMSSILVFCSCTYTD